MHLFPRLELRTHPSYPGISIRVAAPAILCVVLFDKMLEHMKNEEPALLASLPSIKPQARVLAVHQAHGSYSVWA